MWSGNPAISLFWKLLLLSRALFLPQASETWLCPKTVNLFTVGVTAATKHWLNCWNCVGVRSTWRAVMLCLSSRPDPVSSAQDNKECLFSFCESVPLCNHFRVFACVWFSWWADCRHGAHWTRRAFTVCPLYMAMYKLPHYETFLLLSHARSFGLGIEMLARWLVRTEISHQILDESWTLIYVLMASVVPRVFTEHHPQCAESHTSPLSARQIGEDKWSDTSLEVRLCILGKQIVHVYTHELNLLC